MSESYIVRRAFVHEGEYITNDNVHTLDSATLEDRTKGGYLERTEVPATHEEAAAEARLAGVDFASDEAAESAARAGLAAAHFAGQTPSGKHGFTAADVRRLTPTQE